MVSDIVQQLNTIASSGTCIKKQVGCIVLKNEEVLIEAANGRPGQDKCIDGKCYRCKASEHFSHGRDHDLCSCLHAEQNAICEAAKQGIAIEGAWLYSTYQPCLTCLKIIVGSGISGVRYIEPWFIPDVKEVPNLADDYESLMAELNDGCKPII